MAKKIRLDFSKVEESSGWNTKAMPEGLHKMKIVSVQETEAQDGTAMLIYGLVPEASAFKARRFPYYCKIQQNQLWKLRDLLVAAGQTVPKRATSIDPGAVVGKSIAAEVEDETNVQYAGRSVINGTYGLDVLDEDGDDSAPDDEDEEEGEEYEDEADEAEDEEEEYEDEEEEEDELLTLTLPELRKRAKDLDIVTTGLKKADLIAAITEAEAEEGEDEEPEDEDELEDEDLDDEELADEDFEEEEEEEEEPAPAPKRRVAKPAAKAPVRKAAAPVAKAPVKRVVKRR